MSFSLPKFLRKVSAQTLQAYFDERPIGAPSAIKWDNPPRELVRAVRIAIEESRIGSANASTTTLSAHHNSPTKSVNSRCEPCSATTLNCFP